MSSDRNAKLALIALLAGILFNFPIIYLAGGDQLIGGFPQLYFFIFAAWLFIILMTFVVVRRSKPKTEPEQEVSGNP